MTFYAPYPGQPRWDGQLPMAHGVPPFTHPSHPQVMGSGALATPWPMQNPWPPVWTAQAPVAGGSLFHSRPHQTFRPMAQPGPSAPRPTPPPSSQPRQPRPKKKHPSKKGQFPSQHCPPRWPFVGRISLDHSRSTESGILGIGNTPLTKWGLCQHAQMDLFHRRSDEERDTKMDQDTLSERLHQKILRRLEELKEKFPDSFWVKVSASEADPSTSHHHPIQFPVTPTIPHPPSSLPAPAVNTPHRSHTSGADNTGFSRRDTLCQVVCELFSICVNDLTDQQLHWLG